MRKIVALFVSFFKIISIPVCRHFPVIIVVMLMMGMMEACRNIMATLIHNGNPVYLRGQMISLSIWFLIGYVMAAVVSKWNHWYVKAPLYFIVFFFAAVQFFLIDNFLFPISPTYLMLIAETNGGESKEFLNQYVFSTPIVNTLLYVGGYATIAFLLCIFGERLRKLFVKRQSKLKPLVQTIVGIIVLPILYYAINACEIYVYMANCQSGERIRSMFKPQDPFSCLYSSAMIMRSVEREMDHAKKVTTERATATLGSEANDSLNIVLVIGESYIKQHSQLYGYPLQTTPYMMAEKQKGKLFTLNDVVSPSNTTSTVLKNMLCCNSIARGEEWFDAPFFPAVFKNAGYEVYLWDNQKTFNANADYSFTLNSFLYSPEFDKIAYTATNDTSYQYDGQIVEDFKKKVEMKAAHNLVIFHLMGQHNIQHKRYPHIPKFDHFTADSIRKKANYLNKEKKQMIAEYDNSTLYNDYVIHQIIHLFENKNTILFYLSDHGEEVFDFRNRIGREHGPLFDKKLFFEYQVPFMVWCSNTFIRKHPDTIDAIKKAENKPLMSDILFNTLFNVAGIQTDIYRQEDDVLHQSYQSRKRIIEGQLDYDKEMQGKRFDGLYKWQ